MASDRRGDGEHDQRDDEIAWSPGPEQFERSLLADLMRVAGVDTFQALLDWAAEDPGRYWATAVSHLGLNWSRPYSEALDLSHGAPWAEWFVGGGFNYVTNALDRHAAGERRNQLAVIWEGDNGEVRRLTYRDLLIETNRFANALRSLGVDKGDRVGIYLPMLPEAVIAVLACGKIGAVFTPLFSGYGEDAVASRLRDCDASILITADSFYRRGASIKMKATADAALKNAPSVTRCIVVERTGEPVDWVDGRDIWWSDAIAGQSSVAETEPTDGVDPYMIIYTSGTTGKPKGAVHVHAGFPIKSAHDLAYVFDLHPDDTLFWLTDLGWMMGPWEISGALMLGATFVIFEGTPDYPNPDRLWRIIEEHGVTVFGVAPTAIRALMAKGEQWVRDRDLSSLRVLGSTGETWNPSPWRWYFDEVGKGRLPVINYSGGTETGGGIVGCFTILPIKPCSFAGPVPGMIADVVNEAGDSVRGSVGELVMRQPWVGMTRGFWQDPERYLDAYWARFPETWVHGDWAEVDKDGFWFIRGRSDDTLKVAGKRIGPAEVESAAVAHGAVQESAAIAVPHELKGEAAVVFCVLRPGNDATPELAEEVKQAIGKQLGAALRPERVHFVRELPKTRNAKIMRRVIRAAYLGNPTGDVTALENPSAVTEIASTAMASEAGRG
jgi:acetyl-CoA synthetase